MADYHVFCDESCTEDAYRVQGGIWANHKGWRIIRSELDAVRAKHPGTQEFKWNAARGRQPKWAYRDLLKVFFDSPAAPFLSFRCLVICRDDDPSRDQDSAARNLGFYKAYHLLLKYRLEDGCRYRIRLDKRTCPRVEPEAEVAEHLRGSFTNRKRPPQILSCVGLDSEEDDLMQMADILCGAVGWEWNGHPSAAPAKVDLAGYITGFLGWKDLKSPPTTGRGVKFDLWPYQPRGKKK